MTKMKKLVVPILLLTIASLVAASGKWNVTVIVQTSQHCISIVSLHISSASYRLGVGLAEW